MQPSYESLRQKYLTMAKTEGLNSTITHLHNYIGELEPRSFDGGFNKERFELLQSLRELSRDLWTLRLND